MPAKKYPVILSVEARSELEKAARSNKRSLLERQRARILLACAAGHGGGDHGRATLYPRAGSLAQQL